jgi:hypothetical protein
MNEDLLKAARRLLDAAKGDHDEMTQTTAGHYEFELDLAISGFEKALAQQAEREAIIDNTLARMESCLEEDLIPPDTLFVCDQMGAHITRVSVERQAEPVQAEPNEGNS